MAETVLDQVEKKRETVISLIRFLYQNPETALNEHLAAQKIAEVLRNEGFEVEENLGGLPTAFRGTKRNGAGPRIAFIAEYDALPEIGHACGHHLIAGMSVGAALALSALLDQYPGEVVLMGTPAEENGEGKTRLIAEGMFAGIDAAMMIHPHSKTTLAPEIIPLAGFDFTFYGKASHAAIAPHLGINALDAVILFFNNMNALRQQLKDDARVHGIILEGGEAPNSIPARCRARIEIRAKEQPYFQEVVEKVKNCARSAAIATGARLEFANFEPTTDGLKTNKTLIKIFGEHLAALGVDVEENQTMGSTDMGNLSWVVPCIHPTLKVVEGEEQLHTVDFLQAADKPFALDSAILGAKILALTGATILKNPDLVAAMKAE